MGLRAFTNEQKRALEEYAPLMQDSLPVEIPPTTEEEPLLPKTVSVGVVKSAMEYKGYEVAYNQVSGQAEVSGLPPEYSRENAVNILPTLLVDYLAERGCKCSRQRMDDYLLAIADENRFHPVKDMLSQTEWDGKDRLSKLMNILGIQDDVDSVTYVTKWLHQCVAMVYNDNERGREPYGADGVLVLQGAQGCGKTQFFRVLAHKPAWFCEGASINMDDKDSILRATNAWITELGELDSTVKREQPALKAFITQSEDRVRVPYGRVAVPRPRRTSFAATVNPDKFLSDETGNRRYWIVHVDKIDLTALHALTTGDVQQIWAQVHTELYKAEPGGFRLTPDERKRLADRNKQHDKPLPFEDDIRSLLDFERDVSTWNYFKANEIIERVAGRKPSGTQVGYVLSKLEREDERFTSKKSRGVKVYKLPLNRGNAMHEVPRKYQ